MKLRSGKSVLVLLLVVAMLMSLFGCTASSDTTDGMTEEETVDQTSTTQSAEGNESSTEAIPKVIKIAMDAEPDTLDTTLKTNDASTYVAQSIFECLYVYDSNFNLQLMLAESDEMSEDGMTAKIYLREGVLFHDGSEMLAEDVKGSIDRWLEFGSKSAAVAAYIDEVTIVNDYTIQINFSSPFTIWRDYFSFQSGGCWIVPKEIAEAAGADALTWDQNIGTGPFKFSEYQSGRYIKLEKFDEYVSRTDEADGPAGARNVLVDELYYYFVADESTRQNGLISGDYDYVRVLDGDSYEAVQSNDFVTTTKNSGATCGFIIVNHKSDLFKDNTELLRAMLTALNMEEILAAGWGNQELWAATSSWYAEGNSYYSTENADIYNSADAELAKQMAEDAGYNGEAIRIITNTNYTTFVNATTVIIAHLEAAGFVVEEERMDGTAWAAKRGDETAWEFLFTHHKYTPQPLAYNPLNSSYPGWWDTTELQGLKDTYLTTIDDAARYKVWGQISALNYEQVGTIRIGEWYDYDAYNSDKLSGLPEKFYLYPYYWGVDVIS